MSLDHLREEINRSSAVIARLRSEADASLDRVMLLASETPHLKEAWAASDAACRAYDRAFVRMVALTDALGLAELP